MGAQSGLFDPVLGEEKKRRGMKKVEKNASEAWKQAALAAVRHLARTRTWFTPDDVWDLMERKRDMLRIHGVTKIVNPKALGPVTGDAVKRGFIEPDPLGRKVKSKRPERNRGDVAIWWSLLVEKPRAVLIREQIAEENPEALFADGFDDALIGVSRQFNTSLPLYHYGLCIKTLRKRGMDLDEAAEYFEFNVIGSWVGKNTPVFFYDPTQDVVDDAA